MRLQRGETTLFQSSMREYDYCLLLIPTVLLKHKYNLIDEWMDVRDNWMDRLVDIYMKVSFHGWMVNWINR